MSKKRVLLFWPSFSGFFPKAMQNFQRLSITAVAKLGDKFAFDPWVVERMSVHGAMNRAVETALTQGHEYLIAFDDDCIPELVEFPHGDNRRYQVIPRLIGLCEEKGHRIITGVGYMRGYPHTTTVGRKYPWGTSLVLENEHGQDIPTMKGFRWIDDISKHADEFDADGLFDVDFCGVPILCIHREVLTTLQAPLFETIDEIGGQSTHDVYFCNKAKKAGFAIKVDTHIDCGHIVEPPIVNKETKAKMLQALQPKELAHA